MNRYFPFIQFAKEILYDSTNEEDCIVEKVYNYIEETVPNLPDRQFQMNFRMCPEYRVTTDRGVGFPRTSLEKEVMICVWYMSNVESFR